MKFMKLGSKPDSFQNDGDNIRYVAAELATDVVITVGEVKFYLHKFPLLSKSSRLQKLVAAASEEASDEIQIRDIPGGPGAFEICTKFCYGMTVTLNAYNVVAARCAAEYLEMYETVEKGNLIYKIEVFLGSSVFRSWKDSIIVLRSTKAFLPWSDELKVVSHCLDSIASKASIDTSRVDWSYSYNRKKLPSENGNEPSWNGVRKHQAVPRDWWVEDLCELEIDLYKRVIVTIKSSGRIPSDVIGEALRAYTFRKLPGLRKGIIQRGDGPKNRCLIEAIVGLLPPEKGSVPCGFLLKLLKAVNLLECTEAGKVELMRRIGQQLEEATVIDLLIQSSPGESTMYDVATVQTLVGEFIAHEKNAGNELFVENDFAEMRGPKYASDASKVMVSKLVDGYLSEIASDPSLPLSSFVNLAEMVSSFPRPSHDGLYRAIDMYLKEHPGISKTERKRMCRLMDCKKLSREACMHAVQNERLPLRIVVQVLFFEQARAASSSSAGGSTPDLHGAIRSLLPPGSSNRSSRSATTNTEEDWDGNAAAMEELKALKGDLSSNFAAEKVAGNRTKGLVLSKIFSKLWSGKERNGGGFSSSDTSESPGSANVEETKSTPSRSRRHSVS